VLSLLSLAIQYLCGTLCNKFANLKGGGADFSFSNRSKFPRYITSQNMRKNIEQQTWSNEPDPVGRSEADMRHIFLKSFASYFIGKKPLERGQITLINERIRQQATIHIFMLLFILHMGANGRMLQRGISSFRASIKVNVSGNSGMEKICKTYFRCKDLWCTLQR
jgi:hypothetical protein